MGTKITAKNLAELYSDSARRFGDRPAFGTKDKHRHFSTTSFGEVYEAGAALATGLIELGLGAREHVAVLSENRKEWIIANYGILLCGAADVPRGTDVTDADIRYILPHSDARIVFVENDATLRRVQQNLSWIPQIAHVVVMDPESTEGGPKVVRMKDLLAKGKELRQSGERVEQRAREIRPEDLLTIIYTSGTTGEPKGVMLTHANMISQLRNIPIEIGPGDRFLSILPVWHSFERVFQMGTIAMGAAQYYTNVRNIREDLSIVRPTFMASAPRLWESIYQGILSKIQSGSPVKRLLFRAAYGSALRVQRPIRFLKGNMLDLTGRTFLESASGAVLALLSVLVFAAPYLLLDTIVLRKIRQATGGKLRGTVSGGGALPYHIDEFFNAIGIPVLEGYGLTETSPGLAFRTPGRLVVGSVGPLFPETQVLLKDTETGEVLFPPRKGVKGEIHVRGPQIMKGYYKRPEITARVLSEDGWLNTGDLGIMTFNDTLKIVGRTKETIVLLNGENVEPVPIENRIAQSPLVDQVMVVGQDQKFLAALILPKLDRFPEHGSTYEELATNRVVIDRVTREVKDAICEANGFKAFERISDIRLLPKAFEVGDELSAKMSIKRHVVAARYQSLIDSMYLVKQRSEPVEALVRVE